MTSQRIREQAAQRVRDAIPPDLPAIYVMLAEIAAQLAQLNEGLDSISGKGGINVWTKPSD